MATYIELWQKALRIEIQFLKKYGSTKHRLTHGYFISGSGPYTYYFDSTSATSSIPISANVIIFWGSLKISGRILSSEGKSMIIELDQYVGNSVSEITLQYDPWELMEQLINRLEEISVSKKKKARIQRLMKPSMVTRHPSEKIQSNVHELVLRSKYNPVTYVWGPPGTGKTYTLARVAANKYVKGKKILVLAQSNQAVDVIMLELFNFIKKMKKLKVGELLRYGSQASDLLEATPLTMKYLLHKKHPQLSEQKDEITKERRLLKLDLSSSFSTRDSNRLLEIEKKLGQVMEKIRVKETAFVKNAEIIGTTLSKAAMDANIYEKEYDLVIIDEVSMAYVPQIAFAASLGKRTIVCGDFKQLPPIAHARHSLVDEWLREDIFHKAGVVNELSRGEFHPHLFLLSEQRRMHPDISSFTNKHVYMGLVGDHESMFIKRKNISTRLPFANEAAVLLDTSHMGEYCMKSRSSGSRFNIWHLLLSFQLIHESYTEGSKNIGYTTPYRYQAEMMEQLLFDIYKDPMVCGEISCATVHKFQGSEREVMIFDSVDAYPEIRPSMLLTGRESERLINVAITRTKGKFIHVANSEFIKKNVYRDQTIKKLIEHQENKQQIILPAQIGSWVRNQHPNVSWMHARKLAPFVTDIKNAKKEVVLSIPIEKSLPNKWEDFFKNVSEEKLQQIKTMAPFPFVMIDQRILWIGVPVEAVKGARPPHVAVRVNSEALCTYFLAQVKEI